MNTWHYGSLPIAAITADGIKPISANPKTMEEILAKQSRLNVLRPAKRKNVKRGETA